ncbi:hypothetical protein D3C84_693460 [compost metagenome]
MHGAGLGKGAGGQLRLQPQQTIELTLQTIVVGAHPAQQRGRLYLITQGSALEIGKAFADHGGLLLHGAVEFFLLLPQTRLTSDLVQPGTHVVDTGLHVFQIGLQLLGRSLPIGFKDARAYGIGPDHRRLRGRRGFQYLAILLETQLVDFLDHRLLPGQPVIGQTRDDQ